MWKVEKKETEFLAKVTLSRAEDEKVHVTIRRLPERSSACHDKPKRLKPNFSVPVIGLY